MTRTYVIGHVNPDTDSIASAIGYAWLLRERDGEDVIAARAGAINPQTTWVLKRLGLEPPCCSPTPRRALKPSPAAWIPPLRTARCAKPGRLLNRTGGWRRWSTRRWHAAGIDHRAEPVQLLGPLCRPAPTPPGDAHRGNPGLPCQEACDTDVPRFQAATRIRDVLNRILREEHNDFLSSTIKGCIWASLASGMCSIRRACG